MSNANKLNSSQLCMRPLVATPPKFELSENAETKSRPSRRPPLSEAHADLALADITDVCALLRMSKSWVHDAIVRGAFPSPVIRKPRCTRWRLADVRAWLEGLSSEAGAA
jgi:predicted DNA-binding transcriptional regulator AlpA